MTAAEAALWRRIQRRAADLAPDIAAALLRGLRALRAEMESDAFVALLDGGDVVGVLAWLDDARLNRVFGPLRQALQEAYVASLRAHLRDVATGTASRQAARALSLSLDLLDPRTVQAIRQLDTKVMRELRTEIRATVRATVQDALVRGQSPRAIAPTLRAAVGLGPSQRQQVANFRRALEEGDVARALSYERRDRRFDRSIRKGQLTPAQIDRMVAAYERRRLALNAETIARTAALDAQRAAQQDAWRAAIREERVDPARLRRRWVSVLDGRERPAHRAMHGTVVRWDEPFMVPGVGPQMTPGELEYNCRCIAWVFTAGAPVGTAPRL